jgi:hypothetical protein
MLDKANQLDAIARGQAEGRKAAAIAPCDRTSQAGDAS